MAIAPGISQESHRQLQQTEPTLATMTSESPTHRVLVVDDEPNIVDVISMALRFQGFAVESAGTGAEALAAVAELPART